MNEVKATDIDMATLARMSASSQRTRYTITQAALRARVRRRLARDGETLHVSRGGGFISDLGWCYAVDDRNFVSRAHIDLVELARELGVLAEHEDVQP